MQSKISPHPVLAVSSESSVIWAGCLCSPLLQHTETGTQGSWLSSLQGYQKTALFSPSSPKETWIAGWCAPCSTEGYVWTDIPPEISGQNAPVFFMDIYPYFPLHGLSALPCNHPLWSIPSAWLWVWAHWQKSCTDTAVPNSSSAFLPALTAQ